MVDNEEDLDLSDDSDELGEGLPAASRDLASAAPTPAPAAAPPSVKDYIAERLAKDSEGLKAAQDETRSQRGIANMAEGLGQTIAGISRSNTFDPASYKSLHEEAGRPIADYIQAQKSRMGAVEEAAKERQVQRQGAEDDPDSIASGIARSLTGKMLSAQGLDAKMVDGMSASDLGDLQKTLKDMNDRSSMEKVIQLKQQQVKLQREAAADTKRTQQQGQALQQTSQLLESARGNPAAAQAERDIYNAQKAKSLANLYGDPNKLSPEQVSLLRNEIGKIASGGQASMQELGALDPKTLTSKFAKVWEKFSNDPSPANAGGFIKQYMDYTNALEKDGQKVIQDKYGRIIETNKDRLGDENYANLKANYLDRFKNSAPAAENRITVISPAGKKGTVPASQLQAALAQGFKQVN